MQQTQLLQQRTPNYNQKQQIRSCETTATMAYMQSQEPMQYTQPEADGSSDHPHQKPSVMQQTQPPQQRTPNHNQKQQVHSLTQYTVNSDHAQPMEHQQYTSTFPGLPTPPEPHWQKVELKKRPRDIPETHTQNNKQIKLNDYWLNPPPPQTTNGFDEDEQDESGEKVTTKTTKPPPIFVAGVHNIKPLNELLVAVSGDDFELKYSTATKSNSSQNPRTNREQSYKH